MAYNYKLIRVEKQDRIAIATVDAPPINIITTELFAELAWESEVWVADASTLLIHFNRVRFLGPYDEA